MSFQAPMSVKEVLGGMHSKEYLLPTIQREFVWDGDQIRRLVDSLMREYPIGSFLVWKVEPEIAKRYVFYDFLTDYHAKNNPFATKAVVPTGRGVLARHKHPRAALRYQHSTEDRDRSIALAFGTLATSRTPAPLKTA